MLGERPLDSSLGLASLGVTVVKCSIGDVLYIVEGAAAKQS